MSASFDSQNLRTVVLNIGIDKTFLARRNQVLSRAGFEVIDATGPSEALERVCARDVRIAIFGHRLPLADRLQIANELKRILPLIRIVVMYDQSASKTEHADAVLQINVPPADLVHTLHYLLAPDPKTHLA